MTPYQYSNSIEIHFVRGKTLATALQLNDKQSKSFKRFIVGALGTLEGKSKAGIRLLQEIDASPHSCRIFAGGDTDDNCAKSNPDDVANGVARMAINFRPFQKNLPLSVKESKAPKDLKGQPLTAKEAEPMIAYYKEMKEDRRKVALEHGLPTTCAEGGLEFYKVLKRVQALGGKAQLDRAMQVTNLTYPDLREALNGRRKFSDAEYYKLCFYLYDYLTPGPGCSTQVRIQMKEQFRGGFNDEYEKIKQGWGTDKKAWNKLAAVIIGHELVHAWRMMRGRRIVDDGYDEEIMTVGCGPFSNFPLTENSIRRDLNLDTRSGYQPLARYYSDIAAQMISDPDAVFDSI